VIPGSGAITIAAGGRAGSRGRQSRTTRQEMAMAERNPQSAATSGGTAGPGGMTRGITHAITVVLAAFVAGFVLLFLLARAPDDAPAEAHSFDFLMSLYRSTGVVETFVLTAIVWVAVFGSLTELLIAMQPDRPRALRSAIVVEIVAFGVFIALWYLQV
jgi:hypothetical protein